jgi:hypothetical protein
MDRTTLVLLTIAVVLVVLYLQRRRARLNRLEE